MSRQDLGDLGQYRLDINIPTPEPSPSKRTHIEDETETFERADPLADYLYAAGPLRAEPPPVMKWPTRHDSESESKSKLKDFEMLFETSRRSGQLRNEANAQFCLGLLNDNLGRLRKAITHYKAFLRIVTKFQDESAAAIGYNCLGVDFQLLGQQYESEALACHNQHYALLQKSSDIDGKFICNTNLGLIYASRNEANLAVRHHQEALRFAIRSDSEPAQAIAISNIGLASVLKGDYTSARSCMERYLDLCQKARDMQGQARAFHNLGGIACHQGAARSAKNFYEQAIRAAGYIADGRLESQAKVALGIALGKLHLQAISEKKQ